MRGPAASTEEGPTLGQAWRSVLRIQPWKEESSPCPEGLLDEQVEEVSPEPTPIKSVHHP